jgi:hypothetical protein
MKKAVEEAQTLTLDTYPHSRLELLRLRSNAN